MAAESKQAFLAAIEKTYGLQLRRYLAARMRNAASDVADLTQEVYLRLLRIDDHEAIRNPQAYLFTIASHVLHQHRLRNSAAPEMVGAMDVASELEAAADSDPVIQTELEQRFEKLGSALERASPRAYATLVMHRCDGIPLREIANRFGVSYTMVKRYLAQALVYCQKQLEENE